LKANKAKKNNNQDNNDKASAKARIAIAEPFIVFCENLASQIQGDYNTPALAGEQLNPHGSPGG
jgi:hypothetical protein